MKSQETNDAELLALAALVFHQAADGAAEVAETGRRQPPDYSLPLALESALKLRGVLV